jgi:hypothetical protein
MCHVNPIHQQETGVRQFVGAGAGADTAPSMTRCVQHDRFDKKNDMKQL